MNDLERRALGQVARFQGYLALMIFVPAWSMRYWQGWVYWGTIGVASLWNALYFVERDPRLLASRLRGGPRAEKERSQKVILVFASVLGIAMFGLAGIEHQARTSVVPIPVVLAA